MTAPGGRGAGGEGAAERPGAVLLDCDGVLVDTEVVSARVLSELLAEGGVELSPDAAREQIKGTSLDFVRAEAGRRLGLAGPVDDAWMAEFVERRLVEYRRGVTPIPGAIQLVAAIREAGLPLAIVSQGARVKMAVTLPASGLDAALGDTPVFSGDDVERGKPHPDLYLHAAAALGVAPADCVVVEDSVPGVTGAHAAGMRVLGLTLDSDPQAMAAAGAEPIADLAQALPRLGLAQGA